MLHASKFLLPLLLVLFGAGCLSAHSFVDEAHEDWQTHALPPDSLLVYQAFLLGDAGAFGETAPVLRLVAAHLETAGENSLIAFLGDNAYPKGLPPEGTRGRAEAEHHLMRLIDLVRDYPGRVVFLPGEHDWRGPDGAERVRAQHDFIEAQLPDRGDVFLPDDALPGPVEIELNDYLTLVIIDTAWWLRTEHEKPYGDTGDYEIEEDGDLLLALDDFANRRADRNLLFLAHHPLYSNGKYGGFVPLRFHLFPLTAKWRWAYLPLPILGSAYPLYLRFAGTRQSLNHRRYRAFRETFEQAFVHQEGSLVFAGAHDVGLQHFPDGVRHYLVSGARADKGYVVGGRGAAFAESHAGFMTLRYYRDGQVWLEAWAPIHDEPSPPDAGRLLYRTQLQAPNPDFFDPQLPSPDTLAVPSFADSTVTVAANPNAGISELAETFLGAHHRQAWTTPVELPVFDIGTAEGGLTPIKRGGGLQTTSLRLVNPEGREFVLRALDKDSERSLPESLQETIAGDIVRDQNAILHPYAAFIVPKLAEAAGVYHTVPKVYYVPRDPRFGRYTDLVADQVMLFEARPDGDMSFAPNFGGSEEVISSSKLFREIRGDNDHRVDARFYARSRLFDMYLSDWDRHRDQWRWASFEPYELDPTLEGEARKAGKVYRPIPRDRDWAFNRMDGFFPTLIRKHVDIKFQVFAEEYGSVKGLNLNGLELDRRFSASLTRADWIAIAEDLQRSLTDEAIEAAVRDWPAEIQARYAEEFIHILKARRAQLPEVAETWYELLARITDIVGSDKHERFEITRLNDRETEVVVYKTTKEGDILKELFRRTYYVDETREVRVYGLGGNDQFLVSGAVEKGIRFILIGGTGADRFTDASSVDGVFRKTRIYDTDDASTEVAVGRETLLLLDDDPRVNRYDAIFGFRYDAILPRVVVAANKDDGLYLGGGLQIIRHGFRKLPYAARHTLLGSVSTSLLAFNVSYEGRFVDLMGPWEAGLDAAFRSPNSIRNFHGLGNQTPDDAGTRTFYQARLAQFDLQPTFRRRFGGNAQFFIGPSFSFIDVREEADRFVGQPQAGISANTFDQQWFSGAEIGMVFDNRDNPVNPRLGYAWSSSVDVNIGIINGSDSYSRLASDFTLYLSPSYSPQITVAARLGTAHNLGDFPFFEANTLGGKDNLRGYRSTRFAGRTTFYQSVELRLRLKAFTTYLANGNFGVFGFLDNGRVWTEADDAKRVSQSFFEGYHQGYGGGVWTTFFDLFGLTATLERSTEDTLFSLNLGFYY